MTTPSDPDLSALSPLATELATTIARVASDIALVIDKNGVVASVAEGTAVKAQGCASWVGQRWIDTVSASTRPKIQSLLDEVSRQGVVSRRREVNHPAQGGDELPVTWSAIRLGADGPVLAVGRDLRAVAAIQQRFVEAQQDMERLYWNRRQAETRVQLLFQVATDAVLVLAADNLHVLQANSASEALLGHGLEQLRGRALTDSLPLLARAAVAELLATARSTGRAGEIRVRALAKPGTLDVSAMPFRVGQQQQILVRARRLEAGATDSQAQSTMAAFVDAMAEAVVITDSAGRALMANAAFLRLARQADEDRVRGQALSHLLRDVDGAWSQLMTSVSSAGMLLNANVDVQAKDGQPQGVRVSAALLAEGEQTCLGFIIHAEQRQPPATLAADDVLAGLLDQVGRVPLADLLVEATHRAERQLIQSALLRTGGQRSVAAQALGMTPEALELRIHRHGLSGLGYPLDASGTKPLIN